MAYSDILEELYHLRNDYRINPSLEGVSHALAQLGNPHLLYPTVHVTGTNGKGSTCALLQQCLKTSGQIGMYTSPHLARFNERIRINDVQITDEEIMHLYERIRPLILRYHLTFFEATTAMAFLYFAQQGVDLAIIEVGMGGRWDATNVVHPLVSIITRVALDHEDYLGTGREIAEKKADIIKGTVAITLADNAHLDVFKAKAKQTGATFMLVDASTYAKQRSRYGWQKDTVFVESAALALSALEQVPFTIASDHIARTVEQFIWPGRFHLIKPNVLVDGAHNVNGAQWLVRTLQEQGYVQKKPIVVFGASKDKDHKGMLRELDRIASAFVFVRGAYWKSADPALFGQYVSKPYSIAATIRQALSQDTGRGFYVVTGSLYTIGELYD